MNTDEHRDFRKQRLGLILRPGFIVSVTLAMAVILVSSALIEYYASRREVLATLSSQAASLIEAIAVSSDNASLAYHEMETLSGERLLDNTRLIRLLSEEKALSREDLTRIAGENGLSHIALFDAGGRRIASSHEFTDDRNLRESLEPLLDGREEEMLFALNESPPGRGEGLAAAVRLRDGGVIVASINAGELLRLRKEIGVGRLINDVADQEGILYIVLQDSAGIITASRDVKSMPRISSDPFLEGALRTRSTGTRLVEYDNMRLFETVAPFYRDGELLGLLRVGLAADGIEGVESSMRSRLVLITAVLLVGGGLVSGLLVARIQDLTERRALEKRLHRREKLSAMGELASGVAHEVRNPLNAISMIAQRLDREFTPKEEESEYRALTSTVVKESRRLGEIIQRFLLIARPPRPALSLARPGQVIEEVIDIVAPEATAKGVTIEKDLSPMEPIMLDRSQMKQAVLNIVQNSLYATPRGGRIRIMAGRGKSEVAITVSDTGHGIPGENLEKIFDLYFTTKKEGTGMGLTIAHQIVAVHGGHIEVESEPGKGTTFRIHLPCRGEEP
jgi:signal transduction histidine kinase